MEAKWGSDPLWQPGAGIGRGPRATKNHQPSLCPQWGQWCRGAVFPRVLGGEGSLHGTRGKRVPGQSPAGADPHFCLGGNALAQEQTAKQGTNGAKQIPAPATRRLAAQESVVY